MADINLTQSEANSLLAVEKHRNNEDKHLFPMGGQSVSIPLQSFDRRETFYLDISRGRIEMTKVKLQNRARQVVVIARLDLAGSPHRNPDDSEVPCPHIHLYREGFGDKWAFAVPADHFSNLKDTWNTLNDFMRFCNITRPPHIDRGLFT